jgi:dienelactone hydrolase
LFLLSSLGLGGCRRSSATPSTTEASDSAPAAAPGDSGMVEGTYRDLSCTAPGCLRWAYKIGDYGAPALRTTLDKRVTIDNGYTVWSVEYLTGDRTSLGTVTIPYGVAPPARGFAIAGNDHGTVGLDDACKLQGTAYGAGLAGLFGARGMIGVAPDYPGLGTPGVLPYLVSDVEGRAALDALRAAKELATRLGVPVSGRYALAGLSQGGHVTIAAAALHKAYAPELDVRAFAAAAPASVREEEWRAHFVDGPLVPFHAMFVYAWSKHYAPAGPSPWAPGMEAAVERAMTTRCVSGKGSAGGIGEALGTTERAKVFAPAFVTAYESGKWGPYDAYGKAFAANRLGPYAQTAPLKIYQGDADTVIPEPATHALVDALRAGGVTVDYEVVPGATHFDVAFGFVASFEKRTDASIAWLKSRAEAP